MVLCGGLKSPAVTPIGQDGVGVGVAGTCGARCVDVKDDTKVGVDAVAKGFYLVWAAGRIAAVE
jgi:hypothetical protein